QELAAGTYGFYMLLAEDGNETLMFSKNADAWGSFFYQPEDIVLKVKIQSQPTEFTNRLTYSFEDIGRDAATLVLSWEEKKFPFKIETATDELVFEEFRRRLPEMDDPVEYMAAASYCAQVKSHYEEGLRWIDKALESGRTFNRLNVKAGLLFRKEGKIEAAFPLTDESAQIANSNELNQLGKRLLQLGQKEKALEYLELNVKKHPDDASAFDSLGDGYVALGKSKKAIGSFKKSLALNPGPAVKQNAIDQLKKLGVEYKP
ncbi:MAG: DUF2911 domain-containing protein, partial [Bacteroidota bacterium]